MFPIGTRVKVVADDDKPNSNFIDKYGTIIGFKWNKNRKENNLPVVKLDNGMIISGLSLWYERVIVNE